MEYLRISSILIFIITFGKCVAATQITVPRQLQAMKVLLNPEIHSPTIRPVLNSSEKIVIKMKMSLNQIINLDETTQKLTVNVWISFKWIDQFVRWNKMDYDGLEEMHLPSPSLWRPDITLYNSINDEKSANELFGDTELSVDHEGTVSWAMPLMLKTSCKVAVGHYPFDEQNCILKFGSWMYDGDHLDIVNRFDKVDISSYIVHGEWTLLEATGTRNEVYYSCCTTVYYPDVTYNIVIKRRPLFYLFHLLFPCIMITIVGLFSFVLPVESGEKVSLSVTVLLSMTVFTMIIMENIPSTSEVIPLFEKYFGCTILILSFITMMNVVVIQVHFRGTEGSRPSIVTRKFFFKYLALTVLSGPPYKIKNSSDQVIELKEIDLTEKDEIALAEKEWKRIALILDRISFAVFTLSSLLMSVIIFARAPTSSQKHVE